MTVTASGMPKGIKLVDQGGGDYMFQGYATKAGTYLVTVKATVEGNTVTVKLALDKYVTKKFTVAVRGTEDVTVKNLPEGKTLTLQEQQVEFTLCGDSKQLGRIKADDLVMEVDASAVDESGTVRYAVRVSTPDHPAVWAYYGEDETDAPKLYGTLE